jgi:gliding motility-associated-like protein
MIVPTLRSLVLALPIICALLPARLAAQIPTKCLEIESILADACNGAPCSANEPQNEMVRFRTGPDPVSIASISVNWPNLTWLGLVQNGTTANLTAQINATIDNCGWLLEPPGGIIPPGSPVIMVTSVVMCPTANSFSNLTDTLYIVYQNFTNPSSTTGHFKNFDAQPGNPISNVPFQTGGFRTMRMYVGPGQTCGDTATYDYHLLVNEFGTYGGTADQNNGAAIEFSWPGVPVATYVNYGCQAPFPQFIVEPTVNGVLCGGTGTVTVNGTVAGGAFSSVQWSGGTGTFGDPSSLTTTYAAGPGDNATVVLTLCVQTDCVDPICADVEVPAGTGPTVIITAGGPLAICPGDGVLLTASGADSYAWDSGEVTPSITAGIGNHIVTGTNACGTGTASIEVTAGSGIEIAITGPSQICSGESVTLTASGAQNYLWSTGAATPSITITAPGTYSVTGSSSCGSVTQAHPVVLGSAPSISISGDTEICPGESTTLNAVGIGTFHWSTGSASTSITVSSTGTYSVTATNGCGSATASVEVTVSNGPEVHINGALAFCAGASTTLTATGADDYAWSNGATGPVITSDVAGAITVTGTTACGSGEATVTLVQDLPPTIAVEGDAVICPGGHAVLTATGSGTIAWNNGATGSPITVNAAGLYVATATNGCGNASDGFEVTASPLDAAFTPSVTSGVAPLTVQFNNTTTPAGATYHWDFDGQGISTEPSPVHLFEASGTYVITLVSSLDGCTDAVDVVINVGLPQAGSASSVVLPNIFTPNGDRHNDLLIIEAHNIVKVEVLIYNRWGQKVNELRRVGESWDGRSMSGDLVPDGTYFYTLVAEGSDGKHYDLSGHITLLR